MNDIIHLLPDSVANQIAAGEVVQRPSSIIKEMVENSIDADATSVKVLVTDGGKTTVQVIDDGKGMSETDARLSFERHATSKIQKASDLFCLTTMGFRGEALASIAAVAQVELKTRRKEDELGTMIQVAGSKIEKQEPVACPAGSNFLVQNLFFNVPARRKFLKSNQTELTNVVADFQRIVLVHPEISFSLYNNGVEMFHLPAASVRQRIIDVFGKKINAELLPIEVETSLVSISGYVGKPDSSKKKGVHQYFFVNGRYMRHPYFHSAVMKAYENLIPVGEHVSYFIYFAVDASSIDVNVHPTKTEIKFDNEQPIWQVLSAAVRETIGQFCNVPLIDFDVEGKPDIPAIGANTSIPHQPKLAPSSYNPFKTEGSRSYSQSAGWEKLFDKYSNPVSSEGDEGLTSIQMNPSEKIPGEGEVPEGDNLQGSIWNAVMGRDGVAAPFDVTVQKFQYKGRYIVLPSANGIMVVNQHRAHVRVLFDQNMQCINSGNRPSQKELFPIVVQFEKADCIVLENLMEDICSLGFDLSNLGGGAYSVNGIPAGLEGIDISTLLHDMVVSAKEMTNDIRREAQEALALTMAENAAIVYGQVLSSMEMERLLRDLFATKIPARTPDGKLVYTILDDKMLNDLF
ncbi:MAG: DNA mismatch repair endonuclease MutL [Prevotellaceae bacterium]|nr:DNA mismatch repair endonuclease MutL [Bacteroidaceae bacterium]MCI6803622.1 DNA mismatch repair endonuclease MutL [Prevotellaceae bacterium]MDD6016789.1 DNA mismatch repair endonuclease MutL [Prevotellaceae bacterium]